MYEAVLAISLHDIVQPRVKICNASPRRPQMAFKRGHLCLNEPASLVAFDQVARRSASEFLHARLF
jgi:hypothetical protein